MSLSPSFDHRSDLTLNLCTCSASGPIRISSSTWTSAHNDDHDAQDDHKDVDDNVNNDGDVDHNHGHEQDLDLSPRPKKCFHVSQGHAEGKFVSAKAIAIIDLNTC